MPFIKRFITVFLLLSVSSISWGALRKLPYGVIFRTFGATSSTFDIVSGVEPGGGMEGVVVIGASASYAGGSSAKTILEAIREQVYAQMVTDSGGTVGTLGAALVGQVISVDSLP